jgi:hypothetical protein
MLLIGHLHTSIATLLIVLATLGAGRLLRPWLPTTLGRSDRLLYTSAAGTGLIGSVFFAIGMLNWTQYWLLPAIGLLAALGAVDFRAEWGKLAQGIRDEFQFPGTWIAALSLTLFGLSALADPVGTIGKDGISYHLLGPVIWLRDGWTHVVLDHSHTSFPAIIETIFGLAIALDAPAAAGVIGVFFLAQLLLVVRNLAREIGATPSATALMVGIAACMPVLVSTTDEFHVDIPFATFSLLALRLAAKGGSGHWALAAGAMAGFAGGTKYPGLFVIAATGLIIVVDQIRHRNWPQLLVAGLQFSAIAMLFTAPWYLRNFYEFGSPIIPPPPGLSTWLPALGWPPEVVAGFHHRIQVLVGAGRGGGLLNFLRLPWDFTFYPHAFRGSHGTFALLALAPVTLWKLRRSQLTWRYVGWAFVLTVLWFATQRNARFLVHVIALLTALSAVGIPLCLDRRYPISRWCTLGILALSVGAGIFGFVYFRANQIRSVFSEHYAETRRQREIPYYSAIDFINRTPAVEKLLLLSKWVPGYYLNKPYVKTVGQYGNLPFPEIASPAAALTVLPRWQATHLIDTQDDGWLIPPNDQRFKLVFTGDRSRVYEIESIALIDD